MASYPNEKTRPLSRYAIYHSLSQNKKNEAEARSIMSFLMAIDEFTDFVDVDYGPEPPDFVFKDKTRRIGVELTTVNPALFGKGGNRKQEDFRKWQEWLKGQPAGEYTFEWGTFTLSQSLDALRAQFADKIAKAQPWKDAFDERWLLLNLDAGSPFGILVGRVDSSPDRAEELADDQAKTLFEVCEIFRQSNPFDCIWLFSGVSPIAFPKRRDIYRLPMPRWDVVARGARVSDKVLDGTSKLIHHLKKGSFSWSRDEGFKGEVPPREH